MRDLIFHVQQFLPDSQGRDLELRTTLLKAMNYAAAMRGRYDRPRAYGYAADAHDLAGHYVFRSVPIHVLEMAVDACRALVKAAQLVDALELIGEDG